MNEDKYRLSPFVSMSNIDAKRQESDRKSEYCETLKPIPSDFTRCPINRGKKATRQPLSSYDSLVNYKIAVEKKKINELKSRLARSTDEGFRKTVMRPVKESAYIKKEKQRLLLKRGRQSQNGMSSGGGEGIKNNLSVWGVEPEWRKFEWFGREKLKTGASRVTGKIL